MKLGMANWGGTQPSGMTEPPETMAKPVPSSQQSLQPNQQLAEIVESQFPGLEIVELLGEGGMGMVFKARQTSLEREVAVKVIKTDHQLRETFENRFAREAKALASLNHPNIVTVHDFGKTDDYFFLIMEFVDGINVRELLSGQKITPREALEIIPQICDALQYAHDKGVVHRDIKPENILVDRNGRVKIADYGLAKLVNEEAATSGLTRTHHVMGTPHYMAPEQVEKPLSVDHRADIYSLGVVIYEMLTGELPLGRFDLPSQKAQIDSRLDEVVIHSLEKEPDRRYQKVSEVKTDFQSVFAKRDAENVSGGAPANYQTPVDPRHAVAASVAPHVAPAEKPLGRPLAEQHVGQQKPVDPKNGSPRELAKPGYVAPKPNKNPYETNTPPRNTFLAMFSVKTYLSAAYLLISFPLAVVCFVMAITTVAAGIPLCLIWIGFFVLFAGFHVLQAMLSVERKLCKWLLGEEIYYRSPSYDQPTRLGKFTAILTSRNTWWGIVYSLIKFPWSVFCFVLVLVFFTVPLILLAAPILFTQWWFDIDIAGFEVDSFERAMLAALMGFPIFYLGIQITNGLAYVSKKMSSYFLSRP